MSAGEILDKLTDLNKMLQAALNHTGDNINSMTRIIEGLKDDSDEKKKIEEELQSLKTQLDDVKQESAATNQNNIKLQAQLSELGKINTQVDALEKSVQELTENNGNLTEELKTKYLKTTGGFRYNKKHSKHKRQFQELFSRSKTTSKKSKKRRRRPGKSVKKGGMKTRRRRRNKKSKKSKKRRK